MHRACSFFGVVVLVGCFGFGSHVFALGGSGSSGTPPFTGVGSGSGSSSGSGSGSAPCPAGTSLDGGTCIPRELVCRPEASRLRLEASFHSQPSVFPVRCCAFW